MIVFYNSAACNGNALDYAKKITEFTDEEVEFKDLRETSYEEMLASDRKIVLCGGDGTIHHFVNHVDSIPDDKEIDYFPAGTGNDFSRDIEKNGIVLLNPYIKYLPTAEINGKKYKFLNGLGYGLDGYCCEEGDKLKAKSDKPVNYPLIAIKGLLYKFKAANATVKVDGKEYEFKKAWLAPTMNGRYYGGGLCITPAQNRLNPEHKVTVAVCHGSGRLTTLIRFPSLSKGEMVKYTKMFKAIEGHEIEVRFDRPMPVQVDGETITGVECYKVTCAAKIKETTTV